MTISVRRAKIQDFDVLAELIAALADYERLNRPDVHALTRLRTDGWPQTGSPRFKAWLAEDTDFGEPERRALAYAITFETYSSFLARPTLYIEDIFVLPEHRRRGVGSALFHRLVEHARADGCGRVEWVVLDWNTSAQEFYRRHGAEHQADWQYYRLSLETGTAGTDALAN